MCDCAGLVVRSGFWKISVSGWMFGRASGTLGCAQSMQLGAGLNFSCMETVLSYGVLFLRWVRMFLDSACGALLGLLNWWFG